MRRLSPALLLLLAVGCGRGANQPFLGKWSGAYTVDRVAKTAAVADPARNALRGFLQLYATGDRFELHLDGEQFGLVANGTWKAVGDRLTLSPTDVKIDDGGGADLRNPNKAWIDPAELRTAYSRPLALRRSKDGRRLVGLLVDVGPLVGTHAFTQEGSGR